MTVEEPPAQLSRPLTIIGRLGYLSKGLVYILVGILALLLAIGVRKNATDSQGALYAVADTWYGKTFVALIGVGLLCYSLWKFVEMCYDPKHNNKAGVKGTISRIGALISGILALLLAIQAFYISGMASRGSGSSSGGSSDKHDWTAKLMGRDGGRIFIIIVGAIIVAVGIHHGYKAVTDKFFSEVDTTVMGKEETKYAKWLGRFGYMAWCINAILIGSFVIAAAVRSNAKSAANAGFGKTIRFLQDRAYGRFLLGLFAIGVIAYGMFHFFMARYHPVFTRNTKYEVKRIINTGNTGPTGPDRV